MTDQILTGRVRRMRFTGKNKQHGPLRIGDDLFQPIGIFEQQRGALIARKTTREADGEHIWIQWVRMLEQSIEMGIATVDAQLLTAYALVYRLQHARLQGLTYAPKNMIGNLVNALPKAGIIAVAPLLAEVAIKNFGPFPSQKCRHMHAIGDV